MTIPMMPEDLATELSGETGVRVVWRDMSTNDQGFRVRWQRVEGAQWVLAETRDVNPAEPSTVFETGYGTHRFQVASFNDRGASTYTEYSPPRDVMPPSPPPPPPPRDPPTPAIPSGVVATDTGNRSVNLQWQDNSSDETRFEIERTPAWFSGTQSVGQNVTVFLDPSGVGSFAYRLRAVSAAGESNWTGWAAVTVAETAPAEPTDLTIDDAQNERDVFLDWVDNSNNETGFAIERQRWDGSAWVSATIVPVGPDVTDLTDSPGSGTLRYRIRSTNGAGNSEWTAWLQVTLSDGWTDFAPSTDSRIIYVSSSTGNDTNNGLSETTPKRTINAGRALLRTGYPDWILFKRGDTFSESAWEVGGYGGRSGSEPQVWGAYGAGARPIFTPPHGSGDSGFRFNWSPSNIAVVGLHMRAEAAGGGSGVDLIASSRPLSNITLEDCYVEGFKDNINIQGIETNRIANVKIRRCVIVDAWPPGSGHSQGAYIHWVDGLLIEECVFDHNGWRNTDRSDATLFNHDIYIATANSSAIIRRNIIARASSHGLQLRCGGVIEDNLFLLNPIAAQLGGGDPDPETHTSGITGRMESNVVMSGVDINSSNPRGMGLLCYNIGSQGAIIRSNIVANNIATTDANAIPLYLWTDSYGCGVGNNGVRVSDNIFYNWRGPAIITPAAPSAPWPSTYTSISGVVLENNHFQVPLAGSSAANALQVNFASAPAAVTYRNNTYWSNLQANQQLRYNGAAMTLTQWSAATGDTGSQVQQLVYTAPDRTAATYNASLGGQPSVADFLANVRLQSRQAWRAEYTARAANEYFRAGFTPVSH